MIKPTVFIVLTIVLPILLTVATNEQLEAIEKCINSTEIDEFEAHRIGIELLLPEDEVTKSFINCLNNEMKLRDEEGTIQFDKIRDLLVGLSVEEVDALINTCEYVKGADKEDTSFLIIKCLFKEIRDILDLSME